MQKAALVMIVMTAFHAGGPNSNDFGTNRVLHHTIGEPDFQQEMRYSCPLLSPHSSAEAIPAMSCHRPLGGLHLSSVFYL